MDDQTPSEGEDEVRAYTQKEIDALGAQGKAFKNPDGSYSYPIDNVADLENAIRAVGRGNADHDAIRKYIITRAKALGAEAKIPDNWNADGSLTEQNSVEDPAIEARRRRTEMLEGTREVRRFDASDLEVRGTSDGMLRFTGYASVTETPYPVGDFEETIARGAFRRTLSENPDVVLLVNHGEGGALPLARTKSGTMTLREDSRGLRVDADLNPDDPDVKALVPKLQRGDVDEMSFAFRVTSQTWSEDRSERLVRAVGLHKGDCSIVTYGANDASTGGLMSMARSAVEAVEQRAGKSLSAKNRAELEAIRDAAQGLLDGNDQPDADAEEPSATDVARDAIDEQTIEPGEDDDAARSDEPPPEVRTVVIPDYSLREREQLARLRRAA